MVIRVIEGTEIDQDGQDTLYCDNRATINIAQKSIQHDRMKHIEIDRHFIKEKLTDSVLSLVHVPEM